MRVRPPLGDSARARRARATSDVAGATRTSAGPALDAFVSERLQFVFEQRGADRRNVRAVLAARGDSAPSRVAADLEQNLRALPEFAQSEQFRQLATAFKRVRNIARELDATAFAAARRDLRDAR